MQRTVTPIGALVRGAIAGTVGSAAIGAFMEKTGSLMPEPPPFQPPDPEQKKEMPTETVARRGAEMARRPVDAVSKKQLGQVVHFAYGAGWGGLYGAIRETFPRVGPLGAILAGGTLFGAAVCAASDLAILPFFQLSSAKVTPRWGGYMLLAHTLYGLTAAAAYEAARPASWIDLLSTVWATRATRRVEKRIGRKLPGRVRPAVKSFLCGLAEARATL